MYATTGWGQAVVRSTEVSECQVPVKITRHGARRFHLSVFIRCTCVGDKDIHELLSINVQVTH